MDDRTENDKATESTPEATADDVAFARLQAADPAVGVDPNLPALYAAVSDRTGVAVAAPGDELAARRARRAPRWLQVAAVVAGVAVIGGGSYAYGLSSAPETVTAAPPISLDGAGAARDEAAPEAASMAGGGVAMNDSSKLMYPWWGGRTVFTASGLSTEGGSGDAWGFDAAGAWSQEAAAAAAAALGVSGQPRLEYGTWTVGPNDGSGASVSLSPDGLASLSYYDPTRDPWNCVRSAPDEIVEPDTGEAAEGSVGVPEPAIVDPPADCTSSATAPTGDAAIAEAKDALSSVGVDPAGYQFTAATDPGSPQVTNVSASQVLDGQQTGVTANVTLVADGVQSLYAPMAPLVALGSYDVVSPTEAVERLGDPRFGASGGGDVMPLAAEGMRADDSVSSEPTEPTVPATPTAGSPLAWPVQEVTLVSARLGVALTTLPTGASVLVPTYELADADGVTWSVIAVVDDQLDFSAVG
ncbi:hypothetical protein ASD16_10975 [Cellulomonas sp. Root485]|uniref:hypothetical protein n=1 Tax=Cellulomonas sp. Root485 TaxID=1736546 RepID=UPI00070126A2|nr:hypothetical protein [Cellulomonas sp. Root485]KQY23096.1 hypothetical protein ASD16_10975 [Cellulomonas sp. Root485]